MCSTETTKFVARMETPLHTCTAYDELAKKNDSSGCITGCMIMLFDHGARCRGGVSMSSDRNNEISSCREGDAMLYHEVAETSICSMPSLMASPTTSE